jgi:hypothetical protein
MDDEFIKMKSYHLIFYMLLEKHFSPVFSLRYQILVVPPKATIATVYPDIILPVLSAVLCEANDREEIELFGREQENRLRK